MKRPLIIACVASVIALALALTMALREQSVWIAVCGVMIAIFTVIIGFNFSSRRSQ